MATGSHLFRSLLSSIFFTAMVLLLSSCASTEKVDLGTYIAPKGVSYENKETVSAELIEVFGPVDDAAELLNPQLR